jgi:uncharacterized protein
MKPPFHYVSIPCGDLARAIVFYHEVTTLELRVNPNVPFPMAYLVDADGNYPGHLFKMDGYAPGAAGPIVYLKIDEDLDDTLARVNAAGGHTLMPKRAIGPGKGYWALFIDSEGNRLALHSDQ